MVKLKKISVREKSIVLTNAKRISTFIFAAVLAASSVYLVTNTQVNAAEPANDTFTYQKNTPVDIDVATNDNIDETVDRYPTITKINGTAVKVDDVITIDGGTVTFKGGSVVTFTPANGFTGKPTFTYELSWGVFVSGQVEDFEGVTGGLHVQPLNSTMREPTSVTDWGVEEGTGLDGGNSFYGGYFSTPVSYAQAAMPIHLNTTLNLSNLPANESLNISAYFKQFTPNCGDSFAACNESYIGLRDTNAPLNSNLNTAPSIVLGMADAGFMFIEPNLDPTVCSDAGGTNSLVSGRNRCTWRPVQPYTDNKPVPGEYYHLAVSFNVNADGVLTARLVKDKEVIVDNILLGPVAARPWLATANPSLFVDDHVDNFALEYIRTTTATATVTGSTPEDVVTPGVPNTGINIGGTSSVATVIAIATGILALTGVAVLSVAGAKRSR